MIVTQDAAAPGQGVLVQFPRRLRLPEREQIASQVASGIKGVRVIAR